MFIAALTVIVASKTRCLGCTRVAFPAERTALILNPFGVSLARRRTLIATSSRTALFCDGRSGIATQARKKTICHPDPKNRLRSLEKRLALELPVQSARMPRVDGIEGVEVYS
jgi:hypothetical protein